MSFISPDGKHVPSIPAAAMREVDRVAVEVFGLGILQMMENAGRNLAGNVLEMLADGPRDGEVVVLAGGGGNGGGGLCCARHLHNRHIPVRVVLDRPVERLSPPARAQWRTISSAGVSIAGVEQADGTLDNAALIVDALIGYGLTAAPRGNTARLIEVCSQAPAPVVSLDIPSGRNATNGDAPGVAIIPNRTMTLALPKTGLHECDGELVLADIGIPPAVFAWIGIEVEAYFGTEYWVPLRRQAPLDG
ncbi:MAG: NAD(P)H-hydrate epimerase [Vicinamibacterales bacterium]